MRERGLLLKKAVCRPSERGGIWIISGRGLPRRR